MNHILLVDDHPAVGEGVKNMIEEEQDFKVTYVTSSVKAWELIKKELFPIMLFELHMPRLNGLELARRVRTIQLNTPILIYSGYDISPYFNILIEAGISGFVSKSATREQLITAIQCALRGETVLPIPLLQQLRRTDVQVISMKYNYLENVSINEREQKILWQISLGKSNKEIAQNLFISQRTVEYNLTRIFKKLNVQSRLEAVYEAKRLGIIPKVELV